jgi:hypothetical protein
VAVPTEGVHGVAPGRVHCGTGRVVGPQVATLSAYERQYQQIGELCGSDRKARPGQRRRDRGPGTGDGAGDPKPAAARPHATGRSAATAPSSGFHDTIRTAAEVKKQV